MRSCASEYCGEAEGIFAGKGVLEHLSKLISAWELEGSAPSLPLGTRSPSTDGAVPSSASGDSEIFFRGSV